jgi:hypothetical protein
MRLQVKTTPEGRRLEITSLHCVLYSPTKWQGVLNGDWYLPHSGPKILSDRGENARIVPQSRVSWRLISFGPSPNSTLNHTPNNTELTQARKNKCNDNARNEKESRHFRPSDNPE